MIDEFTQQMEKRKLCKKYDCDTIKEVLKCLEKECAGIPENPRTLRKHRQV